MATLLYREGSTHKVNDIVCEQGSFGAQDVPFQLTQGWYTDPADIGKSEEELAAEAGDDAKQEGEADAEAKPEKPAKPAPTKAAKPVPTKSK